jgi:hypothetical protein
LRFKGRGAVSWSRSLIPWDTDYYSVWQDPETGQKHLSVKEGILTLREKEGIRRISPVTMMGEFLTTAHLDYVS